MSAIVVFQARDHQVEVRLEGETVWLTQGQMAELFATTPVNVLMHSNNILRKLGVRGAGNHRGFLGSSSGKRQTGQTQLTSISAPGQIQA